MSKGIRFAPSPTGRFHLGNLRTAWIARQWALALREPFVVRFEDIDTPRVRADAQASQLADLHALGLHPDLTLKQSDFRARHYELFVRAIGENRVYPCDCSRADVQASLAGAASAPHDGQAPTYSGHCRRLDGQRDFLARESLAWRFRCDDATGRDDFIVARTSPRLAADGQPAIEDFVPSYHWACAIDDSDGRYLLLVRATDLRSALQPQRAIQAWLRPGVEPPRVFHTALVVQENGHRLEKRTLGVTLPELIARGYTTEAIIAAFAASFARGVLLSPGVDLEEPRAELHVSEIFHCSPVVLKT